MKALKIVVVCLAVIAILVVASVPWTKSVEAEKWERYAASHHCTRIQGNDYQCDNGKVTKP